MIVAIDGPAGAGKSSVALRLAERLGLTLVDTGAIYRAVAHVAAERSVSIHDEAALARLLPALARNLSFGLGIAGTQVTWGATDISSRLRTPEMSSAASTLSAWPKVREGLLGLQRKLGRAAAAPGAVLEGRDIGTVVFPDAEAKFFLTASAQARAERRCKELAARGIHSSVEAVRKDQDKRDHDDSTRATAPLKQAADALLIDSTDLDLAHVVDGIIATLRQRALI